MIINHRAKKAQRWAFIISALLAAGCASSGQSGWQVTDAKETALLAVDETQPTFAVSFDQEHFASDRLGYYFHKILGSYLKEAGANSVTGEVLFSGSSENFIYSIRKTPSVAGVQYVVTCTGRAGDRLMGAADRNARNLARFIQSGSLEKTALSR